MRPQDLIAAKGSRNVRIAVKATGHGSQNVQWSVPQDWTTLFKGDVWPDFVVFVWFNDPKKIDACRIFVVPAEVVNATARECHLHWHRYPRGDGSPRKNSRHMALTWTGNDTEGNKSQLRESAQGDKWSFCLTAGKIWPANQERA